MFCLTRKTGFITHPLPWGLSKPESADRREHGKRACIYRGNPSKESVDSKRGGYQLLHTYSCPLRHVGLTAPLHDVRTFNRPEPCFRKGVRQRGVLLSGEKGKRSFSPGRTETRISPCSTLKIVSSRGTGSGVIREGYPTRLRAQKMIQGWHHDSRWRRRSGHPVWYYMKLTTVSTSLCAVTIGPL